MKRPEITITCFRIILTLIFICSFAPMQAQDKDKNLPGLPPEISKIVSVSCMPCHSATGGLLSRSALNFDEWKTYSDKKQQKKAGLMYKKVSKNEMPPKEARENNPGIIPTKEQVELIEKWAESLRGGK